MALAIRSIFFIKWIAAMDSRLDFESERVSPGFFGEVDLGSKPGVPLVLHWSDATVPAAGAFALRVDFAWLATHIHAHIR